MRLPLNDRVVAAEKLCGGVVITFADGLSVAFSAELLRSASVHAETLSRMSSPGGAPAGLKRMQRARAEDGVPLRVGPRILVPGW